MIRPFTGCLLTKGQIAFYDLEDAEKVEIYKWHVRWNPGTESYYAVATTPRPNKTTIQMSRLIMGLSPGDGLMVDHINHNTLDNRKENLRIVTTVQNNQNRRNVKGYTWDERFKKWRSQITINDKPICLGKFKTESEARLAYINARVEYGFIDNPEIH